MKTTSRTLAAAGVTTACVGMLRLRSSIVESMEAYKNRPKGFRADVTVPGKPGAVELYHNTDSYCSQAARAALYEAEVDWESHHLELHPRGDNLDVQLDDGYKLQHLSPAFKEINPWCTVPVLVHDGHPVYESKFILEYLASHLAKKEILAKDPVHVKRMKFWLEQAYLENLGGKTAGGCIPLLTSKALIQQQKFVKFKTMVHYSWNHPCRDRGFAVPLVWALSNLGLKSARFLADSCRELFADLLDKMENEFAEDLKKGVAPENVYLAGCGYITIADIIWMPGTGLEACVAHFISNSLLATFSLAKDGTSWFGTSLVCGRFGDARIYKHVFYNLNRMICFPPRKDL